MILNNTHWRLNAACSNRTDLLWFYTLKSDMPELEEAREVCLKCPARSECLKSATDYDLDWTIRGGELPKAALDRPTPSMVTLPYVPRAIKSGRCGQDRHDVTTEGDLYIYGRKAQCRKCMAERYAASVAERQPATHCTNGHEMTTENTRLRRRVRDGVEKIHRMCRECTRGRNRRQRAKMAS